VREDAIQLTSALLILCAGMDFDSKGKRGNDSKGKRDKQAAERCIAILIGSTHLLLSKFCYVKILCPARIGFMIFFCIYLLKSKYRNIILTVLRFECLEDDSKHF
jgi:hypothetical protein